MSKTNSGGPYHTLGQKLRALRTGANESLAEASGAVEIDIRELASFELGSVRPSEDVLLLLISHFGAQDDEAVRMWEMAGYGADHMPQTPPPANESTKLATEQRILFTDVVDVIVNNYGVVMNFMQSGGPKNQPSTVARVGMSREHAKSVLQILQVTLSQTEQNQPGKLAPTDNSEHSANS